MHPILNVVVVSFHHKRGCEVEYSHPKLDGSGESGLPEEWVHLPALALPDGVHNSDQDTIFFLLPSRTEPGRCVFGISCYRQMDSTELLERPDDVTRCSVQKSVCVISRVPLFGALKAKLEVITQAYFEQRDFGKVDVLGQMYANLCDIFDEQLSGEYSASLASHEISLQDLFVKFRHRTLMLFKLILLEQKVLFHASSGLRIGETMLALISMFPNLLEEGLFYASCGLKELETKRRGKQNGANAKEVAPKDEAKEAVEELNYEEDVHDIQVEEDVGVELARNDPIKQRDSFGFPLSIFTQGAHLDPYVSIPFLDVIANVRSCVVGATNALFFATKRELFDVIVKVDDDQLRSHIDVLAPGLDRLLALTTADLRFTDFVIRRVEEQMRSSTTEFDGSDEWIRLQMRMYLLSMAATARADLQTAVQHFGTPFVNAWRGTRNYRIWMAGTHDDLSSVAPGHAFAEQLGVYDVYLRLEHAVQGVEGAAKMIGAVNSTGKNIGNSIGETGSRVKAKFSNWWRGRAASSGSNVDVEAEEARGD